MFGLAPWWFGPSWFLVIQLVDEPGAIHNSSDCASWRLPRQHLLTWTTCEIRIPSDDKREPVFCIPRIAPTAAPHSCYTQDNRLGQTMVTRTFIHDADSFGGRDGGLSLTRTTRAPQL